MELEKLISKRRALFPKQMTGEKIPTLAIEKMLEMANWAPTHRNTEPWRFKVYSGNSMNDLLDQCKQCYVKGTPADKFKSIKLDKIDERKEQVSHILAICMKRNDIVPEWEEVAATAMAVQNMWLTLTETKKYGGYWSSPAYAMGDEFRRFLRLEDDERCLGLFYIGAVANDAMRPEGRRGDWKEKVVYNI
jgi:nitroreductase